MKKDFSPEERLLRLIKGTKKKDAPKKEEPAQNALPVPPAGQVAQAAAAKQKPAGISAAEKLQRIWLPRLPEFNTKAVSYALLIVITGLSLYFIYDIFFSSYWNKEPDIFAAGVAETKDQEGETPAGAVEAKPYEYYASAVHGRNIFMPQEMELEPVTEGPSIEEISANFALIGIIAGDKPQAIIEDKKSGKSYFLYVGGVIEKAKVVEIGEGSVVMEYQGRTFELVL